MSLKKVICAALALAVQSSTQPRWEITKQTPSAPFYGRGRHSGVAAARRAARKRKGCLK